AGTSGRGSGGRRKQSGRGLPGRHDCGADRRCGAAAEHVSGGKISGASESRRGNCGDGGAVGCGRTLNAEFAEKSLTTEVTEKHRAEFARRSLGLGRWNGLSSAFVRD